MAYYLLLLLCALIATPQISVSLPGQHLTVDEAADRALTLHSAGATDEAIKLLTSAVKQAPAHFEASFRLGSLLHVQGRFVEAIAAYEVALALNPTVAVAHGNLGEALRMVNRLDAAERSLLTAIRLGRDVAAVQNALGLVYHYSRGKSNEARAAFERALVLEPTMAEVHFNLGVVHKHAGRTTDAERAFRATLALAPTYASASLNLAALYHENGQLDEAVRNYESTLAIPGLNLETRRMVTTNMGVAMMQLGRVAEAVGKFEAAILLYPAAVHPPSELLAHVLRARNSACVWEGYEGGIARLVTSISAQLASSPTSSAALLPFDTLLLPLPPVWRKAVATAHSHQFEWMRCTFNCARDCGAPCKTSQPSLDATTTTSGRSSRRALRLGYLSYDMNDHPTAHMMEGLFAAHRARERVHLAVYSYGKDDQSAFRAEIKANANAFHDLATLDHATSAERIVKEGVDILIDLQGHTLGGRPEIGARRPAPIQVSYLIFPGTSGAGWLDYLIADSAVTPAEHAAAYSERLCLMPATYQVNFYPPRDVRGVLPVEPSARRCAADLGERGDTVAEALLSHARWVDRFKDIPLPLLIDRGELGRTDHGLPADPTVVVFCNFNKNTKLDPESFAAWMAVLRRVPRSVLWLLKPSKRRMLIELRASLSSAAAAHGVDASRLLYAARVPKRAHLARHRHATLFLDTFVYGAHSTATDALRGGLPVLTCADCVDGGFASRVGKSLMRSLNGELSLLVVAQRRAFVDTAVRLALQPAALLQLRGRLQRGFADLHPPECSAAPTRDAAAAAAAAAPPRAHRLFDTARFGATFEAAMRLMWELHSAKRPPMQLIVRPRDVIH